MPNDPIRLNVEEPEEVSLSAEEIRVIEAVSPTVNAERVEGGVEITVHDLNGTRQATLYDGEQGPKGETGERGETGATGQDGVSPIVTITPITGGHRITITDATGDHSADVMDGEGGVTDVQVNGTSVLSGGVANVPLASESAPGAVKVRTDGAYGAVVNNGELRLSPADLGLIKAPFNFNLASANRPIVPKTQHQSVFYGLPYAAGYDEKSSTLPVGQYTESAKSAISEMLNGSVSVTGTTPSIIALPGVRYVCGECTTLDITLPASGIVDVTFESGATATVLTITPPTGVTLKWANGFDPTSLDANTTYEINIADGLGVAVGWT